MPIILNKSKLVKTYVSLHPLPGQKYLSEQHPIIFVQRVRKRLLKRSNEIFFMNWIKKEYPYPKRSHINPGYRLKLHDDKAANCKSGKDF